jgi:hypothetical protein
MSTNKIYSNQNIENADRFQLLKGNELNRRTAISAKNDDLIPSSSGFDTSKYGLAFKTPINQPITMLTSQRLVQNPSSKNSTTSEKPKIVNKKFVSFYQINNK